MTFWLDRLFEPSYPPGFVINDSKTPSGRAHVGALRGVIIHDTIAQEARRLGMECEFRYGFDDMDPLDELPKGYELQYADSLGKPLCHVPAPAGTDSPDIASYYQSDFVAAIHKIGIRPTFYRTRDLYSAGAFDEAIRTILYHAGTVRSIYASISKSQRPESWLPLQVICPVCGKIGTTSTSDFDGETVGYKCEPGLVTWATGCGSAGRMSPFGGNAKLPWKLEWAAKWATFPVSIEGAGKDHSVRGGSRDVASACLREVFHRQPPTNVPYEFFLLGGSKMSSSKGLGVSAREMSDFLPPEILRYLLVRTMPRKTVEFAPSHAALARLFSDFDLARRAAATEGSWTLRRIYGLATETRPDYWAPDFPLCVAMLQLPHLDSYRQLSELKGSDLTDLEKAKAEERLGCAQRWLDDFAAPDEKLLLLEQPPASSVTDPSELKFLTRLLENVDNCLWTADELQEAVFAAARAAELDQRRAFTILYQGFFGRDSGPRAGALLAFLGRRVVQERIRALAELAELVELDWTPSTTPLESRYSELPVFGLDDFERWVEARGRSGDKSVWLQLLFRGDQAELGGTSSPRVTAEGFIQLPSDDRPNGRARWRYFEVDGYSTTLDEERARFEGAVREYCADLSREHGLEIHLMPAD